MICGLEHCPVANGHAGDGFFGIPFLIFVCNFFRTTFLIEATRHTPIFGSAICMSGPEFLKKMVYNTFLYPATQYGRGIMVSSWTSVCLSVRPSSVRFSFPEENLSKHQWIFTKLGMCIDIVEIWFGIANGQISSNFY